MKKAERKQKNGAHPQIKKFLFYIYIWVYDVYAHLVFKDIFPILISEIFGTTYCISSIGLGSTDTLLQSEGARGQGGPWKAAEDGLLKTLHTVCHTIHIQLIGAMKTEYDLHKFIYQSQLIEFVLKQDQSRGKQLNFQLFSISSTYLCIWFDNCPEVGYFAKLSWIWV